MTKIEINSLVSTPQHAGPKEQNQYIAPNLTELLNLSIETGQGDQQPESLNGFSAS